MIPIVGQPMMEHVLRLLVAHGFTDVVATVQFLGSVVRNYFGDGSDVGLSLAYATEDEPLGTAGGVKNAEHYLDDTFLVISGDTVTDFDLGLGTKVTFRPTQKHANTMVHLVQLQRQGDKLGWKSLGYSERDTTYDK
jgi:NDP-sugar pyrophosphorylase family protein